jgi:tripartite-type tricarboxylate transporter receptor subunit TctC
MCDQTINFVPSVRAGRVKAYAVAAAERCPALPDVPTTAEGGLPEYQLSAWQAMFAPRGVPKTVIEKLNEALVRALGDDTVRDSLFDLGAHIPQGDQRTPQALADLVKKEVARWTSVVKGGGHRVRLVERWSANFGAPGERHFGNVIGILCLFCPPAAKRG